MTHDTVMSRIGSAGQSMDAQVRENSRAGTDEQIQKVC